MTQRHKRLTLIEGYLETRRAFEARANEPLTRDECDLLLDQLSTGNVVLRDGLAVWQWPIEIPARKLDMTPALARAVEKLNARAIADDWDAPQDIHDLAAMVICYGWDEDEALPRVMGTALQKGR